MTKLPELVGSEPYLRFVNPDYREAIGQVIVQWSLMEIILNACIWKAAGLRNDYGWIVCAQMQVPSKLDTLLSLLNQHKPVLAEQLRLITNYIKDYLIPHRNMVAHGTWTTNPVSGETFFTKFSARGRLVSQGRTVPIRELQSLAEEIATVSDWLLALGRLLPKLREQPGGLSYGTPDLRDPQDFPIQRKLLRQPPTRNRKEWHKRLARFQGAKPKRRGHASDVQSKV